MKVEQVQGEKNLESKLSDLKKSGHKADEIQIIRKEDTYVLIYEDKNILNEG